MYPPEIGGKMPEKRKKGQHLTWENRQEIQLGLKNHLSFAAIADVIGCSPEHYFLKCEKLHNKNTVHLNLSCMPAKISHIHFR